MTLVQRKEEKPAPHPIHAWESQPLGKPRSQPGGGEVAGEDGVEEAESLKVKRNVKLTPVMYEQHTAWLLDK